MAEITFNYEENDTPIQCNIDDKIKDIIVKFEGEKNKNKTKLYYLYNGNEINDELTFNEQANELDKNRKKMKIIVDNIEDTKEKNELIFKDIICPDCKEGIFINFKDFRINLSGCKNNHSQKNLALNKFVENQKLDVSCDQCNKKNRDYPFYFCNTCNKNLCPSCNSAHDKNHRIIHYNDKFYICKKHNETFIKYCKSCKQDI